MALGFKSNIPVITSNMECVVWDVSFQSAYKYVGNDKIDVSNHLRVHHSCVETILDKDN